MRRTSTGIDQRRAIAVFLAAMTLAACSAGATTAPSATERVLSLPTATIPPTAEPTPSPSAIGCGQVSMPDVRAEMAAGAGPMNFTPGAFVASWNQMWSGKYKELSQVGTLTPLGESAGFQSYGALIPVSNEELLFVELKAPNGKAQALALAISPDTEKPPPLGHSPTMAGGS